MALRDRRGWTSHECDDSSASALWRDQVINNHDVTLLCKLHNQLGQQPLLCGLGTRDLFSLFRHVIHVPLARKVSAVTISTRGDIHPFVP